MNRATLRLVLLLSCCHAMVHVYELSFGTVELKVAQEYGVGKDMTGKVASCLRLPFGLCALLAGWLSDRVGAKRLLLIYLLGCSGAVAVAWLSRTLALLSVAMFSLGVFASIYHPAGVGLVSHQTTPENRPMALGYHGIFGSAGIAAGPFLAGLVLITGVAWRQYYLLLSVPGMLLAGLLLLRLSRTQDVAGPAAALQTTAAGGEEDAHWVSYFTLIFVVSLAGIVYASMMTFMPRYLDAASADVLLGFRRSFLGREFEGAAPESIGVANLLTSGVLLLGILGQFTAGRIAKPTTLEPLMACAFLGAAPCVLWMGFAAGTTRLWAAALFAPVFFMHQPLFNSLVAKYTPRGRRSLCYGLSFTLGFGVGSLGPTISGNIESDLLNYALLAGLLILAGALTLALWLRHRPAANARKTHGGLL